MFSELDGGYTRCVMIDRSGLLKLQAQKATEPTEITLVSAHAAGLMDIWGRLYRLRGRILVGRSEDKVDLIVNDDTVSLVHAELHFDGGEDSWFVRDMGSTNGTFVNSHRVRGRARIEDHDRVEFGNVSFRFVETSPPAKGTNSPWR
jgi:hypothetical protein